MNSRLDPLGRQLSEYIQQWADNLQLTVSDITMQRWSVELEFNTAFSNTTAHKELTQHCYRVQLSQTLLRNLSLCYYRSLFIVNHTPIDTHQLPEFAPVWYTHYQSKVLFLIVAREIERARIQLCQLRHLIAADRARCADSLTELFTCATMVLPTELSDGAVLASLSGLAFSTAAQRNTEPGYLESFLDNVERLLTAADANPVIINDLIVYSDDTALLLSNNPHVAAVRYWWYVYTPI